jgi:uncharacterized OB-fold protein
MDRPLPVIDDSNRNYWDGARRHRLVLDRCCDCGTYAHPPRAMCLECRCGDFEPTEISGRGRVYSWSVMHSPGNPGFDDRLPYAVLIVELDEQPGLFTIGNLLEGEVDDLEIGMPVEVTWEELTDRITLPQWRPAHQAGAGR